ncbi:Hsp20/alpha crystallin family protein [Geosporobacter ferrireducens]|uniref:SHSP domain-containing protein n=1 Tax=Geosporobacter ferrireducens TaxID=1424294 RepID=A0A1D8GIW6_9FIRM|nr:Hsp20/alpha crystallin family protein [Geosporobacter ferrireducens]AOT70867.1 hypothetical protein Gferi_15665 [Geosporobacter ferrireducens]MTI53572.1 Hsp20/alpha crystallin family protein [Geosporobacter ferrireducens]
MFGGLVPFSKRTGEMENIFERMFQEDFGLPAISTGMRVDIKEDEKGYVLEAEIPGVDKEQIHIDYRNDYLIISVENKVEVNEERENYIWRERKMAKTSRSFYVENIHSEAIEARYENGILKILLPKDEHKKTSKKIEIQ